jgi:hypothetical protein
LAGAFDVGVDDRDDVGSARAKRVRVGDAHLTGASDGNAEWISHEG